jgi:hypothetical protein
MKKGEENMKKLFEGKVALVTGVSLTADGGWTAQ